MALCLSVIAHIERRLRTGTGHDPVPVALCSGPASIVGAHCLLPISLRSFVFDEQPTNGRAQPEVVILVQIPRMTHEVEPFLVAKLEELLHGGHELTALPGIELSSLESRALVLLLQFVQPMGNEYLLVRHFFHHQELLFFGGIDCLNDVESCLQEMMFAR